MNFAQYRKKLKLKIIKKTIMPIEVIKCQYNPDYAEAWAKVTDGSYAISASPHMSFLDGYDVDYIRMYKMYGRNDLWITNKVCKFKSLLEDIRANGMNEMPIVLNKPIVANEFNSGYEIYEGHHRLAIAMYLGENPEVKLCRIA